MFGFVNFWINRVLQNTLCGGDRRFPCALELRSQPGAGNNVNKRTVNSFLSAASTVTPRKATPTDVIFMKCWRDILSSSRCSEENNRFCKKGQFINI
jgi:hypothetical protein